MPRCGSPTSPSRLFPVLDRRAQIDERQTIPDLPDPDHGIFRDRAVRAAPEFLDHGRAARSVLPDQYLRADIRLHRAAVEWKLFNPLPDPGFVPLSTIVAIQFVPLLAICAVIANLHLAPDRLQPARRPEENA
jgi:hypothetical protein